MKVSGLSIRNVKSSIKIHETATGIGTAYVCELCEKVAERCGDYIYFHHLAV